MAKIASTASPKIGNPDIENEDSIPPALVPVDARERQLQADKIVRHNSYWAAGIGTIPVPIVDFIGVGAMQLRMVKQISELYGVTFSESAARNIIGALVGTVTGGVASRLVLASLIKTLPFAGALIGGVIALPAIAGAATYALGRVFIRHYENGGDLLNLSPDKMKGYFREQYEAGKTMVTKVVKSTPAKTQTTETVAAEPAEAVKV